MTRFIVEDIRKEFADLYLYALDENKENTVEIINASFEVTDDYIFCKPNKEYIQRELDWYDSQSLNVYDIKGKIPEIWKKVANKDGYINSNYGWCLYSKENFNQYRNSLRQLIADKNTRRACMIYTRPSMQYDYNKDGMSDFMCTFATQQVIRSNRLIHMIFMRSCDAIFGFRNDVAHQKKVAYSLIKDLKANGYTELADDPTIIWNAGSLHIYPRHYHYIEEFIQKERENN